MVPGLGVQILVFFTDAFCPLILISCKMPLLLVPSSHDSSCPFTLTYAFFISTKVISHHGNVKLFELTSDFD